MSTAFKIYAVKDRLLNYYQQPFIATNDQAVKAALADLVNSQESAHAITQAPHHFELYKLGEVTDEGHIFSAHEFLCECTALIRAGIRNRPASGNQAIPQPVAGSAPQARASNELGALNGPRPSTPEAAGIDPETPYRDLRS